MNGILPRCAFLVVLLVLVSTPSYGQDFSFTDDCAATVNNQTIILQENLDPGLGNGQQIQPGDTVAVYTENGTCAGYGVWSGNGDVQIAAAEDVALTDSIDGYVAEESIKFKVFDESQGVVVDLGSNVTFEACTSTAFPFCSDDGTYRTRTISFVDGLNDGPLPVKLTGFRARPNGSSALLTWQTASEDNSAGFDIQVRGPSEADWTTLSFVEGAGTTDDPQNYRYETDDLRYGTYAFRLRQVDLDGTSMLSDTVEVTMSLERAYNLSSIYPNPAQSAASIDLAVRERQKVAVELYDLLGRRLETVFDQSIAPNRTRSVRVQVSGLASGAYFIRVRGESFTANRRLTVIQ
jgi:hypothetical protein